MASAYQKIDAGQSDWLTPLNTMLKAYGDATNDSGWIQLPLKNTVDIGTVSYLAIRSIGPLVAIKTQFAVATAGNNAVGDIPANLVNGESWRYQVGMCYPSTPIAFTLNAKFELSVNVPAANINQMIDLEGIITKESVDKFIK